MTKTHYLITLTDGQRFRMSANLVEASASIAVSFPWQDEDDEPVWQPTPYQTADARHDTHRAAELCAEYFATDVDDCTEVASVVEIDDAERAEDDWTAERD